MKMHIKNARPAKAPTQAATTVETESEELFKAWDEDVDGVDEGSGVDVGGEDVLDVVTVTALVNDGTGTLIVVEEMMRSLGGVTLLFEREEAPEISVTVSCRLACLRG